MKWCWWSFPDFSATILINHTISGLGLRYLCSASSHRLTSWYSAWVFIDFPSPILSAPPLSEMIDWMNSHSLHNGAKARDPRTLKLIVKERRGMKTFLKNVFNFSWSSPAFWLHKNRFYQQKSIGTFALNKHSWILGSLATALWRIHVRFEIFQRSSWIIPFLDEIQEEA